MGIGSLVKGSCDHFLFLSPEEGQGDLLPGPFQNIPRGLISPEWLPTRECEVTRGSGRNGVWMVDTFFPGQVWGAGQLQGTSLARKSLGLNRMAEGPVSCPLHLGTGAARERRRVEPEVQAFLRVE